MAAPLAPLRSRKLDRLTTNTTTNAVSSSNATNVLRVVLSFSDPATLDRACGAAFAANFNGTCVLTFPRLRMAAFEAPREGIDALRRTLGPSALAFVDGDVSVTAMGHGEDNHDYDSNEGEEEASFDALAAFPWGVDRLDGRSDGQLASPAAAKEGKGVHVFVVDSGVDAANRQFAGRLGASKGFVADGRGANDCNGHGTHVAGVAAGANVGVAPASTVHAVRVLGCIGGGSASGVIAGLEWMLLSAERLKPERSVAVLSLGGVRSRALDEAVRAVVQAGVPTVVAAGNEEADVRTVSPAGEPTAITVAASDENDKFASFSNRGAGVDLIAPGVNVRSAWIGGGFRALTGTSMAAPHVAGLVALVLASSPSASPAQVEGMLVAGAKKGELRGVPPGTSNRFAQVLLGRGGGATDGPSPSPKPARPSPIPGRSPPAPAPPPKPVPPGGNPCATHRSMSACTAADEADACIWLGGLCHGTPRTPIAHATSLRLRVGGIPTREGAKQLGVRAGRASVVGAGCATGQRGRKFELAVAWGLAPFGVVDLVVGDIKKDGRGGDAYAYPWPEACAATATDSSLGLASARVAIRVVADGRGIAAVRVPTQTCGADGWVAVEPRMCRQTAAGVLRRAW